MPKYESKNMDLGNFQKLDTSIEKDEDLVINSR